MCILQCNAGTIQVSEKGVFGSTPVWYHPNGGNNILFLKNWNNKFHVRYDSKVNGRVFQVNTPGGTVEFKPQKKWLLYLDMNPIDKSAITLVTTVWDNFEGFTKKEIEGATKAQEIQAILGHLSRYDFENMVHAELKANCPISQTNITNAYAMW